MFALQVVEELDIVEDVWADLVAGFVLCAADTFTFEQVEEALDDGNVPAVPRRVTLGAGTCCSRNSCYS